MARLFRFTVDVEIPARNLESAVKKLVKALYSAKSHYDLAKIRSDCFQDYNQHVLGEKAFPTGSSEWEALKNKVVLRVWRSSRQDERDREMAKQLRLLADQLDGA